MKPLFPWSVFRAYETTKEQIVKGKIPADGMPTVTIPRPNGWDFNKWVRYIHLRK